MEKILFEGLATGSHSGLVGSIRVAIIIYTLFDGFFFIGTLREH